MSAKRNSSGGRKMDSYAFFMDADLTEYIGKWIVIVNEEIVSSGEDIKKIYNEAKEKYPKKKLLITRVPDRENCIF